MIGDEYPPGRLERFVNALPEASILSAVLALMIGVAIAIVALDWHDRALSVAEQERLTRSEPMRMEPPEPGDQIRPYLPRAIPVGPDRGEPSIPGWEGPVDGEAMAARMRFVVAGPETVSAVGRIEPGVARDFAEFLASPEVAEAKVLHLHSPGGSVEDALLMARAIRDRGLRTDVPADGYCASACPLVLAGGRMRSVGDGAWVGVHQVYTMSSGDPLETVEASVAGVQETIARAQRLLAEMGVDPQLWVRAMETPAASLYVLTREELVDLKVARPFPDDAGFIGPPAPVWPDLGDIRPREADTPGPPDQTPSSATEGSIPEASPA